MQQTCMGACMTCSFGTVPGTLIVARTALTTTPMANIMDNKPFANVPGFIMCTSLANPTVASATSAALGVLTPMPCTPVTVAPWAPGQPTTLVDNMPALDSNSKLMCSYGGVIQFTYAGQVSVSH